MKNFRRACHQKSLPGDVSNYGSHPRWVGFTFCEREPQDLEEVKGSELCVLGAEFLYPLQIVITSDKPAWHGS